MESLSMIFHPDLEKLNEGTPRLNPGGREGGGTFCPPPELPKYKCSEESQDESPGVFDI